MESGFFRPVVIEMAGLDTLYGSMIKFGLMV